MRRPWAFRNLSVLIALFAVACHSSHGGEIGVYRRSDGGIADANEVGLDADHVATDAPFDDSTKSDQTASDSDDPAPRDSTAAFCQGQPFFVKAPDTVNKLLGVQSVCLGQWVSQIFRYGVCSCTNASLDGFVVTGAFDSSVDPNAQSTTWGSAFGINEAMVVSGTVTLGGSVTVAGDKGFTLSSASSIQGDLRVRGPFTNQGATGVARNVWLGAGLLGSGILTVMGDLRQPSTAERAATAFVFGNDLREPVTINPPCACGDSEILDIASIVSEGKAHNDNDNTNFDASPLVNVGGTEIIELPCGKLFTPGINGTDNLKIRVVGRTILLVEGDLSSEGMLTLEMRDNAKLDLFIGGTLSFSSLQVIGDRSTPSNLRVYIAGDQNINVSGYSWYYGGLYAPRAKVKLRDAVTVRGSIFAGGFETFDAATILYDKALLRQGEECTSQSQECNQCDHCSAAAACVNRQCGPCLNDIDCCEPLVCTSGHCRVFGP